MRIAGQRSLWRSVAPAVALMQAGCLHAECPAQVIECTEYEQNTMRLQDCGLFNGTRCCGDVNSPCPGRCAVTQLLLPASATLGTGPGSCSVVDEELQHGESCAFSCPEGYVAQGQQPRCTDGRVSSSVICQPLPCQLTASAHAMLVTHVSDGTARPADDDKCEAVLPHGGRCSFLCESGYHYLGRRQECLYGHLVTSHPGQCVSDTCSGLNPPTNGNMGSCPPDGSLHDGATCNLTCNAGYSTLVRRHPECIQGELHADVQCRGGKEYEEPIWGPLFLGLFFLMLCVLILFLGCSYIRAKEKAEQIQPLDTGYELENMDGPGGGSGGSFLPSVFSRGNKNGGVGIGTGAFGSGGTVWKMDDSTAP